MPSTVATIVLLGAFGGLFYMMHRKGGGCCGGHSNHHSEAPQTKTRTSPEEPPTHGFDANLKDETKK